MTGSKVTVVRGLAVLGLLMMIGVVWSQQTKPGSGRDLTDTEMSRLFGRQPDPGPKGECQWCAELIIDEPCSGKNPCPPCTSQNPGEGNCDNQYWWVFSGNRVGVRVGPGAPENSYWAIPKTHKAQCNEQWLCISEESLEDTMCSSGGCGGTQVDNTCYICIQGNFFWEHKKDNDECDWISCLE